MSSWRLAQELVRRFGTPPPQDTDGGNWYPGAWWLTHADELLALIDAACTAAAPPAEPAADAAEHDLLRGLRPSTLASIIADVMASRFGFDSWRAADSDMRGRWEDVAEEVLERVERAAASVEPEGQG